MKKLLSRTVSLLLCLSMVLGFLPKMDVYAAPETEQYRDMVLEHYSESFANSNYYQGLTNEKGYLYKQWADEVQGKNALYKVSMWCSRMLLDKKLNKEAYTDYLCKLLTMMEVGFANSTAAQASYTAKLSALDYAEGVINIACEDLLLGRYKALKIACTQVGASAKLLDGVITDAEKLGVVAASATIYEQKIAVLEIIRDNTDNLALKKAAEDMIVASDWQMLYMLERYTDDFEIQMATLGCDLLDTNVFTKILSVVTGTDAKENFWYWVESVSDGPIKDAAKTLAKYSSHFSLGFTIGVTIMKAIYGEQAEYYREMIAMDEISDVLIKELAALKQRADSTGDPDVRYEHIQSYEAVAKMLLYTHLRGEFCNVQSRTGEKAEGADSYYSKVVTMLHGYEEALAAIFAPEDVFVVSDSFQLHDGFIQPVDRKTEVPEGYIGIYTYADLQRIIDNQPTGYANYLNEYNTASYILMSDITLPDGYIPPQIFGGVLDGNGYCIRNLQNSLLGKLSDAEIRNLGLEINLVKDYEDTELTFGALARYTHFSNKEGCVIDNCYVTGYINVQIRGGDVGGLVGHGGEMEITNCYNEADIVVRSRQGCNVGGVAGSHGVLTNCFNTGSVDAFATAENTIHAWGIEVCAGGLGGYCSAVRYCYNGGDISSGAAYICRVTAGGILGWGNFSCDVQNCYNTGDILSYNDYPAEKLDKILEDEESYVDFASSGFYAGGIVGWANPGAGADWIENCWNSGSVQSRHASGGIIGQGGGVTISNCCNIGKISGEKYVGGLIGTLAVENEVRHCYNAGEVYGGTYNGALAGNLENAAEAFENCYYLAGGLSATPVGAAYTEVKALTAAEMTRAESFEGFDFVNVWDFKEGLSVSTPLLRFRAAEEE